MIKTTNHFFLFTKISCQKAGETVCRIDSQLNLIRIINGLNLFRFVAICPTSVKIF